MEKIFYIIGGMFLGAIFQNDIPILKDMNHQSIRSNLFELADTFPQNVPDTVDEPPAQVEVVEPKRKRKRLGKKVNPKNLDF